ncbi:MAG: hypothetical protein K1V99_02980 [Bacteroidales bacterium]
MIATTKEQAEILLACKVSTETADMTLLKDDGQVVLSSRPYKSFSKHFREEYCIPAWSLSALLEILPTVFSVRELTLSKTTCNSYEVFYWNSEEQSMMQNQEGRTPIEACIKMIKELSLKH